MHFSLVGVVCARSFGQHLGSTDGNFGPRSRSNNTDEGRKSYERTHFYTFLVIINNKSNFLELGACWIGQKLFLFLFLLCIVEMPACIDRWLGFWEGLAYILHMCFIECLILILQSLNPTPFWCLINVTFDLSKKRLHII